MEIRKAELDGRVTLPYAQQGDPEGTPVLFLHGFADSWRSFEPVLSRLPETIRALALTQRGHGDASRPPSGYDVADLAADVYSFATKLGLRRAVVVGHSMGSAVARRFAARHPDRVLGLVLIGASAEAATSEAKRYWDSVVQELTDPVEEGLVRSVFDEEVGSVPAAFVETLVEEAKKVPAFVWRAVLEARWRSQEDPEELGRIRAPTLVCWGDRDPRYSRADQEALVAGIEGARLSVYAGVGHAPHWEQPERFSTELTAFVRDLPSRT